ncbi:MAG: sugar ABC transporter ATP-binding protein [Microbacterium sp.]|uniref:sugar ABC transporter ATP-binding protein n=1 Tax=Microbacterium sp. TaxID=51671 RepID=UPI0039E28AC4
MVDIAQAAPAAVEPVLVVSKASKSFGGAPALRDVDFSLRPGEVHALIGLNGAGKSTLVSMLYGAFRPDSGTITVDGVEHGGLSPRAAKDLGIAFVPQRREIVPGLSVAENIMLGEVPTRGVVVDWKGIRRDAEAALAALDLPIDVTQPAGGLTTAEQVMIEIARASRRGGRILILDEPTAAIGGQQAEDVRALVKRLRAQGKSVIYISHHLEEIVDLADRVTVMRDGRNRLVMEHDEIETSALVRAMVGDVVVSERPENRSAPGASALRLSGVTVGHRLVGLDLEVRAGEVLGVLGPAGDGQAQLFPLLAGLMKPDAGTLDVFGTRVRFGRVRAALRSGLRAVPGARLRFGVVGGLTINENITMSSDREDRRLWMFWAAMARRAAVLRARFGVVSIAANPPVRALSGGNQQKVLLAKWLARRPRLVFLEEPTNGVDIRAKADIHAIVDELVEEGTAVLVASSDVHEVLRLADRVIVISAGRVVAERDIESTNRDELVALTVGETLS